jgi:hypothetical protein
MNPKARFLTAPLRVTPDFVLLGEAKCGTTFLYRCLMRLPMFLGADVKEPNNFREFGASPLFCRMHYPTVFTHALRSLRHGKVRVGEASAEYFSKPDLPSTLHTFLPGAKLICLFRDPVKRAYSDWQMLTNAGRENLPFEERVRQSLAFLAQEDHADILNALDHLEYHPLRYVSRGMYVRALRRWTDVFPADQILCLVSEDLFQEPAITLKRVCEFLGVEAELEGLPFEPRKQGTYQRPCPEDTARALEALYRPWNEIFCSETGLTPDWGSGTT